MSYRCDKCGKKTSTGNNVSHSHRCTKRTFKPNLQKKRIFNPKTGLIEKVKICTRCIKTMYKKAI